MARGTLVAKQKATLCLPLWLETTGSSSGPPAVDSTSAASLGRPQRCMQVQEHFYICQWVVVALFLTHGWFAVFTRTAQASCLVDEPKQIGQYKYPEQLPGQLYDADTQCKWQFGSKAKLCGLDFVKVRFPLYALSPRFYAAIIENDILTLTACLWEGSLTLMNLQRVVVCIICSSLWLHGALYQF